MKINLLNLINAYVKRHYFLILGLIICLPLYFANAIKYSVPMGAAGLFTQMAQQIADNNFGLPLETPFYGPGGIPFAYPPLGLYILAIFIKLTGKYLIFLRFFPPLLGLLSLIPIYYIANEISRSRIAAMTSIVILATSPDIYIAHIWSAGIVRATAFTLALISIYFFHSHKHQQGNFNIVLAGIFLGLALMTHLSYALFCFCWIWWFSVVNTNFMIKIKEAVFLSLIASFVSSFWVMQMIFRYGAEVFSNAFGSHGGEDLLLVWGSASEILGLIKYNLVAISSNEILFALILLGIFYFLIKGELAFPLFFLFIVIAFPERDRFVFLLGSIFAGKALSLIAKTISIMLQVRYKTVLSFILIVPLLAMFWMQGFKSFSRYSPRLDSETFDLANEVQRITKPNDKYLALLVQIEAEWLPFLFQREPIVSLWGSEWLGTYNEQVSYMSFLNDCQKKQDWVCVENLITQLKDSDCPDFVITYKKDKTLNSQIESTGNWNSSYIDSNLYVFWKISDKTIWKSCNKIDNEN